MKRVAIVSPVRTAVGGFGGALRPVPAEDLAATVIRALVERSGVDPTKIEDVAFAQSYSNSEAPCIGRWAALHAGLPIEVPGFQTDRRCGGGLQAVITAAMTVQTGAANVVVAGGVESMSNIEHYTTTARWGSRSGNQMLYDRLDRGRERSQPSWRFGEISGMIETAENLAQDFEIGREASDAFAVRSHQRAAAAQRSGVFDSEIVPVDVPQRKGDTVVFDRDEGVRPEASVETLSALRSITPDGTVTAGNAAQQNDAAAACLVVAESELDRLGLEPIAWFDSWAAVGCEPSRMGIGPIKAVEKVLDRAGVRFEDLDLIEINEAFAVQVLAVLKGLQLELDDVEDRLNVNGSGISLGHPIGATGVRILTTMLHELKRRDGDWALETMCIGGGQGLAALFRGVSA
jgi:acetyl-CoA C-acetyltransferase